MRCPDYVGGGLVNLVAELERRLTGSAPTVGLRPDLADRIPETDTYLLVLIDALGDHQLRRHPAAGRLKSSRVGGLDAPFSTQTSVATSTLATGLAPARHGLISYVLRVDPSRAPINTLWWYAVDGSTTAVGLARFLPSPNLAERLASAGRQAIVVEPAAFLGSPLDQVLFRGARTRGPDDAGTVAAVLDEVSQPGRLVVWYLPDVDAAGHTEGTASAAYAEAIEYVASVWTEVGSNLPDHVTMVGTADHGMIDIAADKRYTIDPPGDLTLAGDDRVLYVYGSERVAAEFAEDLPATWVPLQDLPDLWGPPPFHPELRHRLPNGLIVANDGVALHYPGNDIKLVGYHGGLTEEELRVPLLVWAD